MNLFLNLFYILLSLKRLTYRQNIQSSIFNANRIFHIIFKPFLLANSVELLITITFWIIHYQLSLQLRRENLKYICTNLQGSKEHFFNEKG